MRVKGGFVTQRRHKKILKMTKGQWGTRSKLFRRANEAMMKSYWYAYRDRRVRRREFRRLWITRINAAARINGISYSKLMHGLKMAEVAIDRKALADIAVRDAVAFSALVQVAKDALDSGKKPAATPVLITKPGSNGRSEEDGPIENPITQPAVQEVAPAPVAEAVEAAVETTETVAEPIEAVAEPVEAKPKKKTTRKKADGDDLRKIEGIGPKIAGVLNDAGITTFAKLAESSIDELNKIVREDAGITIANPGTWPEQAALAAADKWDELEALQGELKGGKRA